MDCQRKNPGVSKVSDFKEQHNEPVVKNQKVCTVDVQQTGKLLTDCHKAICVGDAYTVLQSNVQSQLRDLQKAADIKYARMWNIFSREECYNEKKDVISVKSIRYWTSFWKTI